MIRQSNSPSPIHSSRVYSTNSSPAVRSYIVPNNGYVPQPVIRKAFVNSTANHIPAHNNYNLNPNAPRLFTQNRIRQRVQNTPNIVQNRPPLIQYRDRVNSIPIQKIIRPNNYPPPHQVVLANQPQKIRVKDGEHQIDINLQINLTKDGNISCSHTDLKQGQHFIHSHGQDHIMFKSQSHSQSNRSSQFRDNLNFTVQQQCIHCIICNETYKVGDRQIHLRNHQNRFAAENQKMRSLSGKKLTKTLKLTQQNKIKAKPIIQPEEYNVQYDPNDLIIEKSLIYKSKNKIKPQYRQSGVGGDDFILQNNSLQIRQQSPQKNSHDYSFNKDINEEPTFVINPKQQQTFSKPVEKNQRVLKSQGISQVPQKPSNLDNRASQNTLYSINLNGNKSQNYEIKEPKRETNIATNSRRIPTIEEKKIQQQIQSNQRISFPMKNQQIFRIDPQTESQKIDEYYSKSRSKRRMKDPSQISVSPRKKLNIQSSNINPIQNQQILNNKNNINNNTFVQPQQVRYSSQRFQDNEYRQSNIVPSNQNKFILPEQSINQRETLNNNYQNQNINSQQNSRYSNSSGPGVYNYAGKSSNNQYINQQTQYSPIKKNFRQESSIPMSQEKKKYQNQQTQYTPQGFQKSQQVQYQTPNLNKNNDNSNIIQKKQAEKSSPNNIKLENQSNKSNPKNQQIQVQSQRVSYVSSKPIYNHQANPNGFDDNNIVLNESQNQQPKIQVHDEQQRQSIINSYSPYKKANNENDIFNEIVDPSKSRENTPSKMKPKKKKIAKSNLLQWN